MRKSLLFLLTLLTCTIVMSACSQSGSTQVTQSTTGATSTVGTSAKTVTIELINQKSEAKDTFDTLVKNFEAKNPNIKVKHTVITDGASVFATRAASGDFPETFQTWPTNVDLHQYEDDGFVMDISSQPYMENVMPTVRKLAQHNGKDYTVSISLNSAGVLYNKKVFKDLNLSVPTTWSEFIAVCDTVKKSGQVPLMFSDKEPWAVDSLTDILWTENIEGAYGKFIEAMNGKRHLSDIPEVKEIAQLNLDLRQKYGQSDTLGTDYNQATNDFSNGKAAMFIQGTWTIAPIKAANPKLEFGMFPLPTVKGGKLNVVYAIDCGIAAYSKTKNPNEVNAWLGFLASKEAAQVYADLDGSPSAINGVNFNTPEGKGLVDYITKGDIAPWVSTTQTLDIQSNLGPLQQSLIVNKDPEKYVQELDKLYYGSALKK